MSTNAINGSTHNHAAQLSQPTTVKKIDRPNDGNAENGVEKSISIQPAQSSVNTEGQKVGQIINVTA